MQSYSKGARGLSVLPRVHCIFTAISTSLSPGWRQCGYRYAFRAGRNLPDKEFRYLRTVIVTAAVYRGFDLELHPSPYVSLCFPCLKHAGAASISPHKILIYSSVNSGFAYETSCHPALVAGLKKHLVDGLTPSLNLPAPGRRHTLYFLFRVRRVLCF